MRVLADLHHQALFHSLKMLFEDRLGWELYRPIGEEWWHEGFWHVYNHPQTANQFLGLHQAADMPMDVHGVPLIEFERKNLHYRVEDGIHYVRDVGWGTTHRAVRLEKFREMDFDILVSSIPAHIEPFNKLIRQSHPKAKHIFQVGNRWTHLPGVQNIMASTAPFSSKVHTVFYHQEFDLNTWDYSEPKYHNVLASFVHYMKKAKRLKSMKLPGWDLFCWGAGMDKPLQGVGQVSAAMRDTSWIWQYKPGGDGYGHNIYNAYSMGRPMIVWGSQYKGCLAEELFTHGETCIDVEQTGSLDDLANLLLTLSDPHNHKRICKQAHERFKKCVDFDAEFEKMKKFLEDLR